MLAPPLEGWRASYGELWICPSISVLSPSEIVENSLLDKSILKDNTSQVANYHFFITCS